MKRFNLFNRLFITFIAVTALNGEVWGAWSGSGQGTLQSGVWYAAYNQSLTAEYKALDGGPKGPQYSESITLGAPGAAFTYVGNTSADATKNHYITPQWSTDNSSWPYEGTRITVTKKSGNVPGSGIVDVNAKYFRIKRTAESSAMKDVKATSINIKMAQYIESSATSIDCGAGDLHATTSKTFTIAWCNVPAMNFEIQGDTNGEFLWSIDNTAEVGKYNTTTVTIKCSNKTAGQHTATLKITDTFNNYSQSVSLTATTNKQTATMFWKTGTNVMNVGDIFTEEALNYSDQTRAIVFTTSDAAIIKINDDGYPEAVSEGKATITATQAETAEFYKTEAVQEITVTNKQKQLIEWTDKLSFKYEGSQITQTLTASANTNITYSLSDVTNNCVSLSGNVLTITKYGTAYVTATAAETDEYIGVSMTRKVIIRNPDAACETIIYGPSAEHEFDLGWNEANKQTKTSEIDFGGQEPRYVNFDYKGKSHNVLFEYYAGSLHIDQYVNGGWQEVKNLGQPTKNGNYVNTGNVALNRQATKMRVRVEKGLGYMYYKDLTVVLAKYLEVSTDALSFDGQVGISATNTFDVNYSDVQGPIEITSSNSDIFTFSPNSFDADCEQHGTKQVTVTLNSKKEINALSETITISNGVEPAQTITVSGKVTKRKQDINWSDATTYNSTDKPTLTATATSELPISSYSSDNESIAKVVNGNQLEFYGSGKVNITAHQDGNDFYEPASLTKEFTISKVTPTIVTLPTAGNAITYGSRLGDVALTGGSAKDDKENAVAGHFEWTNPDEIPHGGQQSYTVRFIPDNTDMYTSDAVSTQKLAIMVAKANQTLTWDVADPIKIKKENGNYTLTAFSTSGREITYTLSDPTLGTINGNTLIPLKSGDCIITAVCPADNDYNMSNSIEKQLFIAGPDEIVWKYKEGDHVWAGQNLNADGKLATANNEVWFDGDLNHLTVNNTTNPKMVYTEIASDDALVTISASTLGDDYYASVNSSIQVYIDRCYQGLNWDQSFVSYTASAEGQIDLTIPLTAVAVDSLNNSTNLPIVYSVDNTSVAEITGNAIDGWNLHIKGTGEATLTASVSPTNIYQGVSDTRKINVRREGEHCGSYVLISTGEKNINQINNDTYTFSRPGETLTFKTRKYVAITLNANVTVEGYNIKENAWQNIDKYKLDFTSKQTKTYTISEDFRKIRMYTDADIENNYRYISDLYITQKEYLRPSVQKINAEIYINQDFSQTFTVDYSDKPYINCTIDNDQLEILRDDDNNTCGEYGTISFTVRSKNKWLTPTSISGTITLNTTVGDNITIPVSVDVKLGGTYKFTNATGDGDWTNLNNWDYGGSVPTSLPQMMNQVEIQHPVRVTTNVEVYELEVKPEDKTQGWNGHITIAPTGGITVYNGGVTGIDNKLTIESSKEHTGYFRVVPSVVKGWYASPTATIEFATRSTLSTGANKDATWQYFGPAVEGVNFTADYNTWLYDWSEQKGWVNMRDGKSHSLQPFHGYVITQYGQPVYDFTGSLLMGDYDITLTKTPSGMNGSNIIVNSYPSPIDVTKFTEEDFDEGINKTFYLYNSGSWNQWQAGQDAETLANKQDNTPGTYYAIPVLSAKYLTDCQTIIPPMNGIYVTTTIDGAQMHLSYEKHVWPAFATDMNLPLRAPMRRAVAEDENIEDNFDKPLDRISVDTTNYAKQLAHRVVLRVTSENSGSDRVTLLEHTNHEHFTSGYDNGYDARKMGTQGVVNVFTNEQSGMYAVSATNDIDNMYIGIVSGSDNAYQLSVSSVVGEDLYLKDLVADVEIPLIEGQTYWFNMTPNTENDNRFIILHRQTEPFIPTSSNEINSDAYIWISGNSLHIENASADSYMQLYAADGKLLYTEKINRSAELQINHLPNSVYLVNVDGKQMKFVKK